MKKILYSALIIVLAVSCNKIDEPDTVNPEDNVPTGCGDGYICFNMDGTDISKQAGGYELSDTNLFVKYEEGTKQLSIDIFGKNTGSYIVTDKRAKGNGRIYYFTDNNTQYMAQTGMLNISAYDASARKLTGTFSGTLYKYDNTNNSFTKTDSIVIKDGKFTTVSVPRI